MKILSINGSPRGKFSNTNMMIDSLLRGFEDLDSELNNIYLSEKNIKYCDGCYSCWFKTPGKCIIEDDMAGLLSFVSEADFIILGSPLYFNNISGTLKVFIDRLTALGGDPHKKISDKEDIHTVKLIFVSNCGFPYRNQFDVISLWINHFSKMLNANLIGEFYTTTGTVLTHPKDEQLKSRNNYLEFLTSCGRQYLKKQELDVENKNQLQKNILDF